MQTNNQRLNELLPDRFYKLCTLTERLATLLDRTDAVRMSDSVDIPLLFSRLRMVRDDGSPWGPGEVARSLVEARCS